MLTLIVVLIALQLLVLTQAAAERVSTDTREGYALLIDAGSTGSRAFVFHVTETYSNRGRDLVSRDVEGSKSLKIKGGLSSFSGQTSDEIADYFTPMFQDAFKTIPTAYHKSTQVYIKGT